VELESSRVEISKSFDDPRCADVDAPANVLMRRVRDAICLRRRGSSPTDLVAHLVQPAADVLGVPVAHIRRRRGHVRLLITGVGTLSRTHIRVCPRVGIAAELGGKELAEQATVLRAQRGVVDENATFVDEERGDLGHIRTAIIDHVKTRLLAADSPGAVEEAAAALARGELVAFPTDTVYGLSAGHEHVRKLYGAKDRPKEKRIPVLLSDIGNLEASAMVTPIARALAQRFWPGPLTIVLVAPRRGTMAFRVPDHPLARRLIAASGGGLPVTSANRSGEPDTRTAQEVIAQLDGRIALVLDGGTTPGGVSSTVVDCTTDQIKILRVGAISEAEIESVLANVA
jgi:L-threonylcarbamoyladenylate synthase